ncbi:MAG: DUF2911 domain-containing protein [Ekhidna sp.]|nr:DUF2911 domain-containing protein [Ekhidna sp.]
MKNLLIAALCLFVLSASAQEFPKMDASPMDVAYFPENATKRAWAKEKGGEPMVRVIYSRPQKKDRNIFGELLKYGEVWRLGANESTELMLFKDAKVGGQDVKEGRYALYAIPTAESWEIHLSSDNDRWGPYAYKPEESLVTKFSVPTAKTSATVEAFSIMFEAVDGGTHMIMAWDDTMVRVPIMM